MALEDFVEFGWVELPRRFVLSLCGSLGELLCLELVLSRLSFEGASHSIKGLWNNPLLLP